MAGRRRIIKRAENHLDKSFFKESPQCDAGKMAVIHVFHSFRPNKRVGAFVFHIFHFRFGKGSQSTALDHGRHITQWVTETKPLNAHPLT